MADRLMGLSWRHEKSEQFLDIFRYGDEREAVMNGIQVTTDHDS
jgi:hypothetical protein